MESKGTSGIILVLQLKDNSVVKSEIFYLKQTPRHLSHRNLKWLSFSVIELFIAYHSWFLEASGKDSTEGENDTHFNPHSLKTN